MKLGIAVRAFFKVLFDQQIATQISDLLSNAMRNDGSEAQSIATQTSRSAPSQTPKLQPSKTQPPKPQPPTRDSALNVLAALQREARLVDLVNEDLGQYSDAQVGAAARPCLQQCSDVLHRLFDLQPIVDGSEGESVDVDENASPLRYQWIGEGTAASGKLIHHGWQAGKVELPKWSGEASDANVIAPAQVQAV